MPHFAYYCNFARREETLLEKDGTIFAICSLQCEDEHGHPFAETMAVVRIDKDSETAQIEKYAENILDPDENNNDNDRAIAILQAVCNLGPGYDVYDEHHLYNLLTK